MDQIKIGKFIAEMRKEQNMTQIDLADALGISNKTVSKWETGNGMPDYALVESLCGVLKINANELLSGERLPSNDYSRKAEENIMSLMQENSTTKKKERFQNIGIIIGTIGLLFTVSWMITMSGGIVAFSFFIDIPTILICSLVVTFILIISGHWKAFWKAFTYLWKVNVQEGELKDALLAIKTGIAAFILSGALMTASGTVICLAIVGDSGMSVLTRNLAVALLGITFGLFMSLVLAAVYSKLKSKL